MFSFVSGSIWGCLHARWRDEVEEFASNAEAQLSHRVCMGCCQQFHYHRGWHNFKAPCDQKDGSGWRSLSVSFRYNGINLFQSYAYIPLILDSVIVSQVLLTISLSWTKKEKKKRKKEKKKKARKAHYCWHWTSRLNRAEPSCMRLFHAKTSWFYLGDISYERNSWAWASANTGLQDSSIWVLYSIDDGSWMPQRFIKLNDIDQFFAYF